MQSTGRRHERFSPRAILIATGIAVALASPARAAQTAPAQAAFEECRVLFTMAVYHQAIARCDEAVRLEPKWPNPYMMLGSAHDALSQEAPKSAPPDESRIPEHRRKAYENYKRFLALTQSDTELRRRTRPIVLKALLGIYISGEQKDEAALEYAHELAREPLLARRDLLALAGTYLRHGRPDLSEQAVKRQLEADPSDVEACQILAQIYHEMPGWIDGPRFDDRIRNLELCAAKPPGDPTAYHRLATFFWDKVYRGQTLTDKQKLDFADRGLSHASRALALEKDYLDAMIFKGLLLRIKASAVSDPVLRLRLIEEAEGLQKRALAMKAARDVVGGGVGAIPREAIRVGGDNPEPRKLTDVRPVYPAIAQTARVQGDVILECTIDPEGKVVDAKILRSIPLLDHAALDAVRQWVFAPTLYKGVPVPVIMTVTVTFKLS